LLTARVLAHWLLTAAVVAAAVYSYGYDPLGLGKDKETVEKYRANELIHARWAMLAAAGIIIPEGLQVRDSCSENGSSRHLVSATDRSVCLLAVGCVCSRRAHV
jgi:hypothetical protein